MTKKTIGIVPAILIALVSLVIGAACTWQLEQKRSEQRVLTLVFGHEIEVTGLCVNGLKLSGIGDSRRLDSLLDQRLDSAVVCASDLVREGARFDFPTPNFQEAVKRAAAYYATNNNEKKRRSAKTLFAAFKESDE